jgi:hypothetical protein
VFPFPSSFLYGYAVFAAELVEELSCRSSAAICYVVQVLSNALISIGARGNVEQALMGLGIPVWQRSFHTPKLGRSKYRVKDGE